MNATPPTKKGMNGKTWLVVSLALIALVGVMLTLVINTIDNRLTGVEDTVRTYEREGRLETPEQKITRIDSRIQHFYVTTIRPDLQEIKHLIQQVRDENHDGG